MYHINSTEVEDGLVSDAGEVGNDVRNVSQCVHDQLVHACQGVMPLLGLRKVLQFPRIFAPHLAKSCHNIVNIMVNV